MELSPAPLRKAYSYSRVSSGQQVSGGGLERQEAMAQEWCVRHGYELDTTLDLSDAGRSAYRGDHLRRGALGKFLELAKATQLGQEPVLLIEAVDRLSRQEPLDALSDTFLALVRSGVAVVDLEDGQRYDRATLNSDPLALVKLSLKVGAAHDYSRRLGRRVRAHWEQARERARNGQLMRGRGGTLPFWLEPSPGGGWQVIEERAEAVRLIFRLALDQGMTSIAQELNRRGIPGPSGNRWRSTSVGLVLKSPAAWGARVMNHRAMEKAKARRKRWEADRSGPPPPLPEIELVEGYFPAVVTREEFEQAARARDRREGDRAARARTDGLMHTWLQGLVTCRGGSPMTPCAHRAKGRMVSVLRCRAHRDGRGCSCSRTGWKSQYVEAHVLQRIPRLFQVLAHYQTAGREEEQEVLTQKIKAAERDVAAARQGLTKAEQGRDAAVDQSSSVALLEQLADVVERRQGDVRAAEQRLAQLHGQLSDHQRRQAAAAGMADWADTALLRALADSSSTTEQRRSFNALLKRVGLRVVLNDADVERRQVELHIGPAAFGPQRFQDEAELWQALAPFGALNPTPSHESPWHYFHGELPKQ